jgi:hypothetical protein
MKALPYNDKTAERKCVGNGKCLLYSHYMSMRKCVRPTILESWNTGFVRCHLGSASRHDLGRQMDPPLRPHHTDSPEQLFTRIPTGALFSAQNYVTRTAADTGAEDPIRGNCKAAQVWPSQGSCSLQRCLHLKCKASAWCKFSRPGWPDRLVARSRTAPSSVFSSRESHVQASRAHVKAKCTFSLHYTH